VGALTALAFVLIIGRAERFQCGKQIASYLGLVPLEESSEDKMIPPDAQRAMSKRAGATVVEVKGSHAVYVSRLEDVASLIEKGREARCRQRSRFATFTESADLGPGRIARRFRTMRSGYLLSQVRFETVSSCRVVTNAWARVKQGSPHS
jgi:hypothetical protein